MEFDLRGSPWTFTMSIIQYFYSFHLAKFLRFSLVLNLFNCNIVRMLKISNVWLVLLLILHSSNEIV
jgi:hypothetical protein